MEDDFKRWRKSRLSEGASNCVELARTLAEVRDSKNPDGATLTVGRSAVAAFMDAVRGGRFGG